MLAINTAELFSEIESLPLDVKTKLIEKLLSSINPVEKSIDMLWKNEIDLRVESIDSGTAELVDGENVFQKIKAIYKK